MKRMDRNRNLLIAASAVALLSIAAESHTCRHGSTARPRCQTTFPQPPPPPLNIDTVKELLLDYHQQYYDIDVAAVFNLAQKLYREKSRPSRNGPRLCSISMRRH